MEVLLATKESQMALRPHNSLLTPTFSKDAGSMSLALDISWSLGRELGQFPIRLRTLLVELILLGSPARDYPTPHLFTLGTVSANKEVYFIQS